MSKGDERHTKNKEVVSPGTGRCICQSVMISLIHETKAKTETYQEKKHISADVL